MAPSLSTAVFLLSLVGTMVISIWMVISCLVKAVLLIGLTTSLMWQQVLTPSVGLIVKMVASTVMKTVITLMTSILMEFPRRLILSLLPIQSTLAIARTEHGCVLWKSISSMKVQVLLSTVFRLPTIISSWALRVWMFLSFCIIIMDSTSTLAQKVPPQVKSMPTWFSTLAATRKHNTMWPPRLTILWVPMFGNLPNWWLHSPIRPRSTRPTIHFTTTIVYLRQASLTVPMPCINLFSLRTPIWMRPSQTVKTARLPFIKKASMVLAALTSIIIIQVLKWPLQTGCIMMTEVMQQELELPVTNSGGA